MARPLKYATPLIVYVFALLSFTSHGWLCWLTLFYAWIIIPIAELILTADHSNMDETTEVLAKKNRLYDYLLYSIVPLQYGALVLFLYQARFSEYSSNEMLARTLTMGLLCGTFGINVGHELGHRTKQYEQWMAKALLLTSLYMHFFVEHNKGHHKNVATKEDPSSARLWEPVYSFYIRTIILSYISAWRIAASDMRKRKLPALNFRNEMVQIHLIEIVFVAALILLAGMHAALYFFAAAAVGILLLETVNYIEHYGLSRKAGPGGSYERAMPWHSWNSDHIIGRLMLFELSRHSDHHYLASRKYQVLRHHNDAPEMPTGYPGMMILSLIPPLWFYVMHRQMRKYNLLPIKNNSTNTFTATA